MITFNDYMDDKGIDYIVILVPEELLDEDLLLQEGKWVPTGEKDYMQRVDPEDPALQQQRHVHIARERHTNAKNMQAAWNKDGSRHDRKSFNSRVGSIKRVRQIARTALDLDDAVTLERVTTNFDSSMLLLESQDDDSNIPVFRIVKG